MNTSPILALLVLCACSEPDPPAVVTPEETPAEEAAPDEATPEVTPESGEDTPPPPLPDSLVVPENLQMRMEGEGEERGGSSWPVIQHPDEDVRRVLASTIAGAVEELAPFAVGGVICDVPLAHEQLVSVICSATFNTRGGMGVAHTELVLAIADGSVHPVAPTAAFIEGTDIGTLARERCEADRDRRLQADEEGEDDEEEYDPERYMIAYQCDQIWAGLGRTGIVVNHATELGHTGTLRIPYTELRDRIRLDGPLAPVLGGGPARLETVSEDSATGWAVTAFGQEPALVGRWMELDPATADRLVVDDFGGGLARIVRPGSDAEPARLIASALGAEATPVRMGNASGRLAQLEWDDWWTRDAGREAHSLRWVRTVEDLNLRRRRVGRHRSPTVLAVLPAGSLIVAVGGELRQPGQYVPVVTAFGPGALASRHLRAHTECVIAPGEDRRHVARVSVRDHGASRDAWLVVERHERGSRVALHERGDDCSLGDEILAATVERPAFDVRLTATTARGGTTLLLVGSGRGRSAPGEARYRVWRVGSRRAVLDESFELDRSDSDLAVRLSETVDATYFPVTLEVQDGEVRRYVWADGELTAG